MVALQQNYVETVAQHYDTRRFHFLDETGLRLNACRRYVRARGRQRVGQAVQLPRRPSLTLIGTLSAYVSRFLAHTLRPGDMLVLDNLAVRKIGGLREWLAKRGV